MTANLAFHNDPALAEQVRAQVAAHTAADEIIQGIYWEEGKGCFIGCIAHSDAPSVVESLTGFPVILTSIAESIFEGLPNKVAKDFPQRVISAPQIGADLSLVGWKFLHWCVTDALHKYGTPEVRKGCAPAVLVLTDRANGVEVSADAATDAATDAVTAATAACAAADANGDAAAAVDAAYAAADAAYAATDAVTDATAVTAACAAREATYASDAASIAASEAAYAAADANGDAAREAARIEQADKLIELLEAAHMDEVRIAAERSRGGTDAD